MDHPTSPSERFPMARIPVIDDEPDPWRSPRLTPKKAGHKLIGTVRFDGS